MSDQTAPNTVSPPRVGEGLGEGSENPFLGNKLQSESGTAQAAETTPTVKSPLPAGEGLGVRGADAPAIVSPPRAGERERARETSGPRAGPLLQGDLGEKSTRLRASAACFASDGSDVGAHSMRPGPGRPPLPHREGIKG